MSRLLRVHAALRIDRKRRVGGAERAAECETVEEHAALAESVDMSVFGIDVDRTGRIDDRRVDAPLEAFLFLFTIALMAGDPRGVAVLPLDVELRIELGYEIARIGAEA